MDFLTNGFHQLYSELDCEFIDWDCANSNSTTYKTTELDNIFSDDYYKFVDEQESFQLNNTLEYDPVNSLDDYQPDFVQEYTDLLACNILPTEEHDTSFHEVYSEQHPELTDFLSERTPFCNDSCNLFIKEGSKNLNTPWSSNNSTELLETTVKITDNETEKIFPCTYGTCSKVYAKPAHLKAHLRRHIGDKPYICNWPNCTWRFSRSDELARHRRSHSGIKPYKCTYCTKCFARSDHLSKHLKVHERKMAANKIKGILTNFHRVKPGRKPKDVKGSFS